MLHTTSLHTTLPMPTADGAPDWVHLVPAGTFSGADGRGPYSVADPAAVIAASMAAGRLVLDENHATDHGLKDGRQAPAQGWIIEMQSRDDGIWGRVEWTDAGRGKLADKAYRGFSPVFEHDPAGAVSRILRAALTNVPNLPLTTLHSQGAGMDFHAQLRQALGLAETVDEAGIVAAAAARHTATAAHAAQLTAIGTALGSPGLTADGIVVALQSRGSADALQMVTALQTQLTQLTTERARDLATAAVDAAMRDGKPIPPALRADFIARHMADPVGFGALIDGMPNINAGGVGARAPNPSPTAAGIDPAEAQIIALMGIAPDKFLAAKGVSA